MSDVMTVAERAKQINDGARLKFGEDCGILCEEQAHWEESNIHTGEDLDRYLCWCDISDTYKEIHGFRPRWDTSTWSLEDLEKCMSDLLDTEKRSRSWEEQERQETAARELEAMTVVPLTTSMSAFCPR